MCAEKPTLTPYADRNTQDEIPADDPGDEFPIVAYVYVYALPAMGIMAASSA